MKQQDALATAKHDSRAAAYWKGAIGRAPHAAGTSALQQTAQARLAGSHTQVPYKGLFLCFAPPPSTAQLHTCTV